MLISGMLNFYGAIFISLKFSSIISKINFQEIKLALLKQQGRFVK
jgi:hypothetical protein